MATVNLTAQRLREVLDYDPETGLFEWRQTAPSKKRGRFPGCLKPNGYYCIRIDYVLFQAHRLAWLYVHGIWPDQVDHINGTRGDNRIINLRSVDMYANAQNRRGGKGSSGLLGVHSVKGGKGDYLWRASIGVDGTQIHLGCFATPEEAHQAYLTAKRKWHEGCTI